MKNKRTPEEISPTWEPNSSHFEMAQKFGHGVDWVNEQAQIMKDWAMVCSHAPVRMVDWDAMFRTWIQEALRG